MNFMNDTKKRLFLILFYSEKNSDNFINNIYFSIFVWQLIRYMTFIILIF